MKLKFSSPTTLVTFQMLNSYIRPGATIGTEEITTFPSLQDAALEPSCLNMVAISHMWLLSTWDVASENKKLDFILFYF